MLYTKLALVAAISAVAFANPNELEVRQNRGNRNGAGGGGAAAAGGNSAGGNTLLANSIQTGSNADGSGQIGADATQALSLTSTNNFINHCAGKTLTNGLQQIQGSCNGIVMGDIPAKTNMVSSTILFPTTGGKAIASGTTFNISVQVANLEAGAFTNADTTYYAAPQTLRNGNIVGHTHVTVQDMGNSLNPQAALDPTKFSFFKGINDAGNGNGLLQAVVTGGLPAGNYRVCTMSSSSNHQPVLMPVAQRGAQDDCTKFVVSGNGNTINEAANNGAKGLAAAALVSEAVVGFTNPAFAASVIASESSAAAAAAAAAANTGAAAAAGGKNTGAAAAAGGKGGKKGNAAAGGAAVQSTAAAAAVAQSTTAAAAAGGGRGGKKGNTAAAAAAQNTAAAAAQATTAATRGGKKAGGKATTAATPATKGVGKGRGRGRKQRFAKREFVA